MTAAVTILVEIDVTSPLGAVQTLRFADRAIRPLPPTDAARANAVWDARLVKAPSIRRALLDDFGSLLAGWGVGAMQLANGDGALDQYEGYAWGEIRVIRHTAGQTFSAATRVFTGRAAQPSYASRQPRASVSFYDYRLELDPAAQSTLYAGTGGYEGLATDLKGKPKPVAYGDLTGAHVPAPRVAAAVNAYQFADRALAVIPTVYDGGASAGLISDGAVSSAAFDAATPAAAHQVADLSRALLKFNANPVHQVTLGGMGEDGVAAQVGPIVRALLLRMGVPAGRIGASVAALVAPATVGAWAQDTTSARDLVQWLARSVPAAILPDRAGVWQAIRLAPPAADPAFTIGVYDSLSVEPDDTALDPVGEVRVGWGRIWSTFSSNDLAASVKGTAVESQLAEAYRFAVDVDAAAKARGVGNWRTLTVETALRQESDALALAATLKALFGLRPDGRPRRQWKVQIALTDAALAVALGATVRLIHPPRGIDQLYVLIAEQPLEPRRDQVVWTLWG